MKNLLKLTSAVLLFGVLTSCNKNDTENDGAAGALIGNWKFVELNVKSTVDITVSEGGESQRTISTSNYTTTKNGGLLNINGTKFTLNDLEYSVNTMVSAESYINGVSMGTDELPFEFTLPKIGSLTEYKAIGSDSLHFTSGTFIGAPGVEAGQGSGARYVIEGNKLTMINKVNVSETKPYPNYPSATLTSKTNAVATSVFERQ